MHIAYDPRLHAKGPLQALDARCKILAIFGFVVCAVSVPAADWRAPLGFLTGAALLLLVSRIPLLPALRRLLLLLPVLVALAVVVPFTKAATTGPRVPLWPGGPGMAQGALLVLWNVSSKALVGLVGAIVLAGTTGAPRLLEALDRLKVPRVIVLTMSFIHRYAVTLKEELDRMKRARDARGWRGRWFWQAGTLGGLAGALFLRSYERGERVWHAMLARGYRGRLVFSAATRLQAHDVMFVVWIVGAGLALRFAIR